MAHLLKVYMESPHQGHVPVVASLTSNNMGLVLAWALNNYLKLQ